jgi:hypothetical protein
MLKSILVHNKVLDRFGLFGVNLRSVCFAGLMCVFGTF